MGMTALLKTHSSYHRSMSESLLPLSPNRKKGHQQSAVTCSDDYDWSDLLRPETVDASQFPRQFQHVSTRPVDLVVVPQSKELPARRQWQIWPPLSKVGSENMTNILRKHWEIQNPRKPPKSQQITANHYAHSQTLKTDVRQFSGQVAAFRRQ